MKGTAGQRRIYLSLVSLAYLSHDTGLGYRQHISVSLKEQMIRVHRAHRLSKRWVAKLIGVHWCHPSRGRRALK